MKQKKLFVKRSCLTGEIVWCKFCASEGAARIAYWRACKNEVRRVRHYAQRMKERRRKLLLVIGWSDSSSASSVGIREGMTPNQRKAVREIAKLDKDRPPQSGDFYEHIKEEARRRDMSSSRWHEQREKQFRYGQTAMSGDYHSNGRPHGGDRKSKKFKESRESASSKA